MNVLMLNVSKGWAGTEAHSITLASALLRRGNKVVMGCLDDGVVRSEAEKQGIPVADVRLKNTADKVLAAFNIRRLAYEMKADVVVSNCGNEVGSAAIATLGMDLKLVFFMHGMVEVGPIKRYLLTRHFDATVAVSRVVGEYLIESGVPEERVRVIHNGVDTARFNPESIDAGAVRQELGISKDDIVIGTAARLCPEKGVFELIRAFETIDRKYPVKLLIAGDGPSRAELEALTTEKSLSDKVVFTGRRQDIERLYAAMDIFTLPAVWEEPFGLVVIEAMAMRRPVVASRVGGIVEIVEDGKTGVLVPPGDVQALSSALTKLIDDRARADAMALEGMRLANEKFSSEAMAAEFERTVCSL